MAGARRKARAIALKTLYEIDATEHKAEGIVGRLLAETKLTPENGEFVRSLVKGVIQNKETIDEQIRSFASAWPLAQMSLIDKNILRLAIFEILFDNNMPVKVAINEAVELGKAFGSSNSAKFINGVLGSVSALAKR